MATKASGIGGASGGGSGTRTLKSAPTHTAKTAAASTFRYEPTVKLVPYGLNVHYNQGSDYAHRSNTATADDGSASGFLRRPDGGQVGLWISSLTAAFSTSGEVGQSRMLREYFPRSFNDVTLQITGNVASSYEYNRLAAFVREHHWEALDAINSGNGADQTLTFHLFGNKSWQKGKRNVKGPHRPWVVTGYIKSMAAGATAHEVAPEFNFEFVVTTSQLTASTGIWSDTPDNGGSTLKTMLQLLAASNGSSTKQGSGFVQPTHAPQAPSQAAKAAGANVLTWSNKVAGTVLAAIPSL